MNALLLVVEDEPVLRISLVRGLSKLPGVTAVGAGTIAEALEIIEREPPRLIVSDIDLPDGNGLELVSVLDKKSLTIPVIYASAYVAQYRVQIPDRSNITVLEKPVPLAEIRKQVTDRLSVEESRASAPFDATDYLQLACMCRKSVDIVLHAGAEELGHILIRDGELWGAEMGAVTGEEALRELVFASGVTASCVGIQRPQTKRTIHQSWESILLEAARVHDETQSGAPAPFEDEPPVTLEFDTVEETTRTPAAPETTEFAKPETQAEPDIELDYVKRERRLREYEESQYPERNTAPPSTPSPPPSNYVTVRFKELYEEGVDALLERNYQTALVKFAECHDLVPSDPKVIANLARLAELGYSTKEES